MIWRIAQLREFKGNKPKDGSMTIQMVGSVTYPLLVETLFGKNFAAPEIYNISMSSTYSGLSNSSMALFKMIQKTPS